MRELRIQLRCVQDVLDLVTLTTCRPFPVYVTHGDHRVDAKSFMEMFSLNLLEPVVVTCRCDDEDFRQFCLAVERFAVN